MPDITPAERSAFLHDLLRDRAPVIIDQLIVARDYNRKCANAAMEVYRWQRYKNYDACNEGMQLYIHFTNMVQDNIETIETLKRLVNRYS